MLQALFGFRGRLNRLQFAGWCVVWLGGTIFLATVASLFLPNILRVIQPPVVAVRTLSWGLPVILLCALLWAWVATVAKRLRDMGVNPWIGWPAFLAAMGGLSAFVHGLFPGLPASVQLLAWAPLFLWPSHRVPDRGVAAAFA